MRVRFPFLLILAASCSGAPSGLTINVVTDGDVVRPSTLAVSWMDERGAVFQRRDVPVPAEGLVASIFVYVDRDRTGDRRVLVRGRSAGAVSSVGALRVPAGGGASQTFTVTLRAALPDADGDELPDEIDDCPRGPCAGADLDAGAPADAAEGADVPSALPDAGAPVEDASALVDVELPASDSGQAPADAAAVPDVSASRRDGAPAAPIGAGLVAWWSMEESAGTTVRDQSPTGNHGAIVRASGREWTEGHQGTALALTGSNWMSVPSSKAYDASAGLTLSVWVFWDRATNAAQVVVARQRGIGYQNAFWLGMSGGIVHFSVEDQGVTGPLPAGRWVHLAGTYDGARVILYVEGAEVARGAATGKPTSPDRPVSVGADLNTASPTTVESLFTGRLDDVAIYNRALGPAEIGLLAR